TEIKPITAEEAETLLAGAADHRHLNLYRFLLTTGVRLGEALALRWHDDDGTVLVDVEARRVSIRYTLERLKGQPWQFSTPKSAAGTRLVPLTGPALAALKAQRARIAALKLKHR